MNVGINITFTNIGVSAVMLSIIGLNATKRLRADIAAMQKITKVEWRATMESDSFVTNQFDIQIIRKNGLNRKQKNDLVNWSILFTHKSEVRLDNKNMYMKPILQSKMFRNLLLMGFQASLFHVEL